MKKILLLSLLLAGTSSLFATDYFWVGGAGKWSDLNHWVTTSGGTIKHSIVPSAADDVYFDANSGFIAGSIVEFPTTGDANCRNMSWVGVTQSIQFRNFGGQALNIYGNVELSATVAYAMMNVYFLGSSNTTIRFNGAKRFNVAGWYNPIFVRKPGATLTFLDDMAEAFACNWLTLDEGTLDIANRSVYALYFNSNNSNTRNLQITNATITAVNSFDFRGANKTLAASGSVITTNIPRTDGGVYNKILCGAAAQGDMNISSTTIDEMVFTNPAATTGSVRILGDNIIRRLEFKGGGNLRLGGNVIEELIIAPGKGVNFFGTNTINQLLRANTNDCSGLGELSSPDGAPSGILNFGAGAVIDIKNVYIRNLQAAGAVSLPLAVTGADGGNTSGFTFNPPATGTTMYWVGGKGDWNDNSHWSATSGGSGGYCVPFMADNVIFDANSGFTPGNDTVFTTSKTWCHNMTWVGVPNNPVFQEHSTYPFEIWGSLILDATVTMNTDALFTGTEASTVTSNGNNKGSFIITINRSGTNGGITLTDNLIHPNLTIRANSGKFLLPGKTMQIFAFVSIGNTAKTIDLTNATVVISDNWNVAGGGRTSVNNAAGSFITAHKAFSSDVFTYPKVLLTSALDVFNIRNATIGELIFDNTSAVSKASLQTNNKITSVEFKGAGIIGAGGGGNIIGTLLLAPSRNYDLMGNNTINTHLRFNSPACSGLGELRGYNGISTLSFGASATASISNVYVQNMTAAGSLAPLTVSGADAGSNTGFIFNSTAGSDRYWVGGSGDWNDNTHWSATPGGPGGACVPTVNDNVFFTASSFTAGSSTITTTGNTYAKNMDWTGATNNPTLNESASFNMEIWGNLVMNPAVTMNANLNFMGSTNSTINVNGSNKGDFDFTINKNGGGIKLGLNDNLINSKTNIVLQRGSLDMANRTISILGFTDLGAGSSNPTAVDITNTNYTGGWIYTGSNKSVAAANSTITSSFDLFVSGGTYNKVEMKNGNSARQGINNTTFESLVFSATGASTGTIGANNNIKTLEFKARGNILGNNTIGTMIFAPGSQYTFGNGTNTTITDAWYGSGTPCNPNDITSATGATVTANGAAVNLDYIRFARLTAAGTAAPFTAKKHSINNGGNVNWNIEPYAGSSPIEGFGADKSIPIADFPYRLTTDGFFGSPLATYLWSDNSTLDHLDAPAEGYYVVKVSFPDGCSLTDGIRLTAIYPLPIRLTSFTVISSNCTPVLKWNTADALNFSRFIVERSTDGAVYTAIGTVDYSESKHQYSYTDNSASEGRNYYRLRLVDVDGKYKYSAVTAVKNSCGGALEVFPTTTADLVQVVLPAGYENASVRLFNAAAQEMKVSATKNSNKRMLSLSHLPNGYYFVQVSNGTELKTVKVMKR